jgi:hypothetical protein
MEPKRKVVFIHHTLKGHGNEADFLEFLQKLVPYRFLTLPFQPFRIWLRIRGDIRNRKTTPRLEESATLQLDGRGVGDSPTRRVEESLNLRLGFWMFKRKLGELESRLLPGSHHGESRSRYSNFIKFFIDFPNFKQLNQPFKRSICQKRGQGCNVLSPLIYLKVWKKLYL